MMKAKQSIAVAAKQLTRFAVVIIALTWAIAVPAATDELTSAVNVAPVVVDGVELFRVRGVSALPAEQRAERIAHRITAIADDRSISVKSLTATEVEQGTRIAAGDHLIVIVVGEDAALEKVDRKILAAIYLQRIAQAIEDYRRDRSVEKLARNSVYALLATVALAVFLWLGGRMMHRLEGLFERRIKRKLDEVEAHSLRIISAVNMWRMLQAMRGLLWSGAILVAIVIWLNVVLQLFPWTRWFGSRLFALLIAPLRSAGQGLLGTIPDLIFLAILYIITRYVLRALRLFFDGIAAGRVTIAAFDREWAWPTYRLVRLLVVVFAVVVAYPYIPGSESDAFKGITVFLGIVFSLGSSSLIGNIIAGYSMTYRRAFRIGDRIQINEHIGDVMELRLLVTRLHTPKNEEVVVPNSVILNSNVINYSTLARDGRLILHTTVGIGYETPWRQVEAMLLQAAERTEGLLREPKPFVLQRALGDFAVTYEINAYCGDAQAMDELYTRLYGNIQDVFNEYGVQIMTPAYRSDPAQPKIVPKEQWYAPPAAPPGK